MEAEQKNLFGGHGIGPALSTPVLGGGIMSITVPEGWPDEFRRQGSVACDGTQSNVDRVAALHALGSGLDGNDVNKRLPQEILCFFTSLVVDGGQPVAVRVGALQVLRESLDRDILAQVLRNEILSFCAGLVSEGERAIDDEAMIVLRPTIRFQARCAARFANQAGRDLVDESEGIIAQRLKAGKFEADKPFEPWCYQVLRCESIDRFRRLQTDALGHRGPSESEPPDPQPGFAVDQSDLLTAPFSRGDSNKLEGLSPVNRLIALCESHLWRKASENDPMKWGQWVDSAGGKLPFPPGRFAGLDTQHQRMECLATALGLTTAAVKKRWFRDCLPVLCQLDFFRSLEP